MNHLRISLARAAASILAIAASAAAQSLFSQGQVLLAESYPMPGIPGATNGGGSSLDFPAIDLNGNVLFRARFVGGATALTDRALFLGRTDGSMQLLVRSGDPEPTGTLGAGTLLITQSSPTLQLGGLGGSPRISPENGLILYGSGLIGPSIITTAPGRNDSALFVRFPGGATQVLVQRGAATGVNGTLFDTAFGGLSYQTTSFNSSGLAAFQATLIGGDVSGTTNNFANFIAQVGQPPTMILRKGDIVPVAGPAGSSCQIGFVGFNVILNAAGMVLHDERFNTTGGTTPATTANDSVLMIWSGGTNQIIMREGDPAPLPSGTGNYGSPSISQGFGATGGCAFGTTLTGGTVTAADDAAIFVGGPAGFQLLHREGNPAPGLPGVLMGVGNFNNSYSDYLGGSVAFYCTLTDAGGGVTTANDQSLWVGSNPTNLTLVAREGNPAPGFANVPGFVSATFGPMQAGVVQMNARGQMVFSNVTVDLVTATGTTSPSCTYAWDPVKGLQLLFASGDPIPTLPAATAGSTSGGVQFPSGDGCPISLNNQGDVVQRVNFATGGAIVRTHLGSNNCSPSAISTVTGGVHTMQLDAGLPNANQLYIVACSGAGSRPGFTFGGALISLNIDFWTDLGLALLNSAPWANTFGVLNASGQATATFTLPPGLPVFAGQDVRHALVVIDINTLNVLFSGEPCGMLLY